MRQKVFLITGFQNWGKSFIIKELFNGRERFYKNKLYKLCDKKFCVQSQSNDDWGETGYINAVNSRLKKLGSNPDYIISAFCPTKEPSNDSIRIIKNLYQNADIYLIALEYKWCLHAQLNINELTTYYSNIHNLQIITINEKDPKKKTKAVEQKICSLV
ncbi:hypothetical protein CRV08_08115 [Halarcobacter ebronensis]|uniref:G domain-containing protein n=1 Tax=Halarcobacter ebronensis TaxID=1462615 RepID=A0A4Q0YGP4_9BACT|nr:hypothetical protein [Halarcobacter ebronensis]RXJ68209.1 hypothetical protein CRV08_08115 [Halarcobacter ebronensis]